MVQLEAWLWIKQKKMSGVAFSYAKWYQCLMQCLRTL